MPNVISPASFTDFAHKSNMAKSVPHLIIADIPKLGSKASIRETKAPILEVALSISCFRQHRFRDIWPFLPLVGGLKGFPEVSLVTVVRLL